jgi:hypothetical protein
VKFRPFAEARDYVHTLKLKNAREWEEYCKTGNKPSDIPSNPGRYYLSEWNGYGDWLGTNTARPKRTTQISYRPFDKARAYVSTLGLKSRTDWKELCESGRPKDIPSNPNLTYREEWKGWGDWLGTKIRYCSWFHHCCSELCDRKWTIKINWNGTISQLGRNK